MAEIQEKLSYLHRNYSQASLHLTFTVCDFTSDIRGAAGMVLCPLSPTAAVAEGQQKLLPPRRYSCAHLHVCRGLSDLSRKDKVEEASRAQQPLSKQLSSNVSPANLFQST